MNDELPAEFLLDGFPSAIRETGRTLRSLIFATVPGAVETVRTGWRWIAYSLPEAGRVRNFAWIGPERKHIHLGFEHGTLLADPELRRVQQRPALGQLRGHAVPRGCGQPAAQGSRQRVHQ